MNKARWLLLLIPPLVCSACQRYARVPLDLRAHQGVIEARDPAGADVAAYANKLAATDEESAPYDPTDGLTLREAEAVALFFNPQLRLARLRANVARVGAAEAGRWADPELGIDAERIIESVENPWVLAGTLSLTIPLSGRLGAEKDAARAEATAEELRAFAEEREVVTALRREWIKWSAAHERAALMREVVEELGKIVEQGERLRDAGELDPISARLLQLEVVRRTAGLRREEAELRGAEVQLKTRLGLIPTAGVTLVPSLAMNQPGDSSVDDVADALTRHPRVRVARSAYEVAERTLATEIRKQYPDLRIGGGYGTDEGDERVLLGLALPLPILNANRRAIAEARAGREVARAAAEAEYEQLLGDVAAAQVELQGAEARADYVAQELAPLADRQVSDVLRLGNVGDFSAIVLLEALTAAHEAKLEVLDARVAVALARTRLTGLLEDTTPGSAREAQP